MNDTYTRRRARESRRSRDEHEAQRQETERKRTAWVKWLDEIDKAADGIVFQRVFGTGRLK